MSDYDKKIEETKELCAWFNEHQQEILEHGDGVIITAVYDEPQKATSLIAGDRELISSMFDYLIAGFIDNLPDPDSGGELQ